MSWPTVLSIDVENSILQNSRDVPKPKINSNSFSKSIVL